ncbi:MAG: 50S ribosomal protein L7/L12 [candidate division WOR-3 bacterium]|nr:50S ribosomal protein L7/L12 [candidate division WOR-3 bacterium]MCX7947544.1 50S ribosomal protein L7/L12 [candidate division WOR-3 bacterium]MDW8150430.1 50S ribosomal protein L7/L12 [candidate division WOR-3 bacterium]
MAKLTVEQIVEAIESLTVIELSELVKALEQKFGVSAVVPVSASAVSAPTSQAAPVEEEKSVFDVLLVDAGDKKIQVLKVVRELTGLGLAEAKALLENLPKPIKEGVSKQEANEIKKKLEEVGAKVELK